ncbi:MAG: hypothetical protein QOF65_667 [Thermoleophilaceae bacterium]|jgi:hypothetical protein|nr:hypothetical protein [Thermoleophilaceae bacterium]
MNALGSPAAAGTDDRPFVFDRGDWLRLIGGMMFAAGALVLLIRKGSDWSDWAVFFALLIPAAILLVLAFLDRLPDARHGWKAAFVVFGTLLLLGALLALVRALGGEVRGLNVVWTFGIAAAVAVATAFMLRTPFQMLLGALFGLVAWLALWDKILTNPSGTTVQWLLVLLAVIYFVVALALVRAGHAQGSDLITAAGIAAILAASLSLAGAASSFTGAAATSSLSGNVPKPSQGWNIFLLVVSLLLIGFGSRGPTRGPSYVGALGLGAFIGLTGADLVHRVSGGGGGGVAGWPLILLIGGAIILALGFVLRPGMPGGPGGPATAGPGGPGQAAYAAPPAAGQGYQQPQAGSPATPPPPTPPPPSGDQPTQQQPAPGPQPTQVHQQPPPPGGQPPQA